MKKITELTTKKTEILDPSMRDNNNDDDDDIILLSEHRVKSVIDDDILLMGDSSDDCDKHNHSEDDDIIEIGYFECKPPKKKFKKSEIIDLGNDDFTNGKFAFQFKRLFKSF